MDSTRDSSGGPGIKTLCAPNAGGGPDLIPGQGPRIHMLQLKILPSATKPWCSQTS